MSGSRPQKVGAAGWAVCAAVVVLGCTGNTWAATITNYLDNGWPQYSLAINAGDTVVWVNQQPDYIGTNYVESYGGEWKSPALNEGDSFSFTFTNPGFYVYRTGVIHPPDAAGTVSVTGWTGAPPPVTMNSPIQGSIVSPYGFLIQASVTNADSVGQIEFFADSALIGTATNAPYQIVWGNAATQGSHVLQAKATDQQGGVTWSQPVSVTIGPTFWAWGPRLLPTGELLIHYNSTQVDGEVVLEYSDSPLFSTYFELAAPNAPGIFVDESVRGGTVGTRFYRIRFL